MTDEIGLHRLTLRKRAVFLAVLAFIGLGLTELAARAIDAWTYVSINELREVYQNRRQWRLGEYWPLQRGDYPYLPFVLNPEHADINELGFRGKPFSMEKAPGTYRIAFLGGSTTYCAEVSGDDKTWPYLVVEAIKLAHPDWRFDYIYAAPRFSDQCLR